MDDVWMLEDCINGKTNGFFQYCDITFSIIGVTMWQYYSIFAYYLVWAFISVFLLCERLL